jgi:hypothetical protein
MLRLGRIEGCDRNPEPGAVVGGTAGTKQPGPPWRKRERNGGPDDRINETLAGFSRLSPQALLYFGSREH